MAQVRHGSTFAGDLPPDPREPTREPRGGGGAEVQKWVKELERELRRKDKALAETATLLVLEKRL